MINLQEYSLFHVNILDRVELYNDVLPDALHCVEEFSILILY
jgi:hypothetical protein